MPQLDPAIMKATTALGHQVLGDRDDIASVSVFGQTTKHLVMKAHDHAGRALCLKIAFAAVDTSTDTTSGPSVELEAMRLIGPDAYWAPTLIDAQENGDWILRTWVGEGTANQIKRTDWTKQMLDQLWTVFADAFATFHGAETPYLIRDIKPTNVSYDAKGFYLFDFNTAKPLPLVQKTKVIPRLGNLSNRYTPPEALGGDFTDIDLRADYFAFASVFHRFATGLSEAVWTNAHIDQHLADTQYKAEYLALKSDYAAALRDLGYSTAQSDFLIACLNPTAAERPSSFQRL